MQRNLIEEHVRQEAVLGANFIGALADLGKTSDDVASKLRAAGIKGRRAECRSCPVARYLAGKGFDNVVIGTRVARIDGTCVSTFTPAPVSWFIEQFDMGGYPDLIETASQP